MMAEADLNHIPDSRQLLSEQVALLFRQGPASVAGTMVAWLAVVLVFQQRVDAWRLALWAVPIFLINVNKLFMLYRYSRASDSSFRAERWLRRYKNGAIIHGMFWGGLALLGHSIPDPDVQLFTFYVVGGMALGAIATTSAAFGTFVWFVLPLLTPMIVLQFSAHGEYASVVGGLMVFFTLSVLMLSFNYNKTIKNTLQLRLINNSLIKRLTTEKENAQEANRAKSQFLAHMSHEIRTPINAIVGFGQLLGKTSLNAVQSDYLAAINLSTNSLLGVINDILDLSSIESGKVRLEKTMFSLRTAVEEPTSFLAGVAYQKGLRLVVVVDEGIPDSLIGYDDRLRQVLVNLLGNGIKYTDSGSVELHVSELWHEGDGLTLRFSVRDTGVGIDAEDLKRLFQPFTQLENFEHRRFAGTGLGLSISKRLVELMGGRIGVASEKGSGTEFFFTVPLGIGKPTEPGTQPLRGRTVALLEGDRQTRGMLAGQLRALGGAIKEIDGLDEIGGADLLVVGVGGFDRGLIREQVERLHEVRGPLLIFVETMDPSVLDSYSVRGHRACVPKVVQRSVLARAIESVFNVDGEGDLAEVREQPAAYQGRKVLVVDDNVLGRRLLVTLLKQYKLDVLEAADGEEALEVYRAQQPELVFMDIQLPKRSGLEVTQVIREEDGSAVPIIATTAHVLPHERSRFIDAGMNDVFIKPINFELLNPLLHTWLKRSESAPQAVS